MVMLKKFKHTQEQWGGSSDVIDHWLETRQRLIVEYCKLASLQPCANKSAVLELPSPPEIHSFCEHLVDYISEGHYQIYDMVMDKWQSTGFTATDEINQTYAKIVLTTEPLIEFYERYSAVDEKDDLENFDNALSDVGETMEYRFEVEDQLIQLIADSLSVPPGA
ncbi:MULTISPECIES: Rsd/AlgQ family anti-sigma factor [Vibrio]|uniref:Sigma-D factor regulatory protein n=1 Tax=Vibrio proteolyticus NBRC 13287 TaxID=1219065 RepID=U3A6T7_VIBPR|nr:MULTISPECIES: Rsd/AlgQ family anti-sigma factor [Vibrio]NAW58409.1 Rsd/AlgQ family anti-sigma factor [Vibrio sp. V36_P2S2PM302]NAX25811.1 Rsd/AlgQ family anti-sigma factor [Vibrio sp. V38_P2S17PM301]NAX31214.1 Rsd/AlgQ family anti-sigma factor [Vibrio sp. V37_P2S8PM304]GAD69405.1 sigma-D factor regulatory protein [Vibrio proteolyticus NBRC 13287]